MDVNETKQWIIARIDCKHDNYLEELGINEGRYDQWSNSIDRWVKNGRNYVFSVIGGVLSVLLGLLSANLLSPLLFYFSLAIIIICAVLTFSISNKISNIWTDLFNTISQFTINGQDRVSQSRNYFTSLTTHLDKLSTEDLQKYSNFVEILLNATIIPIFISYSQLTNAKWLQKETADQMTNNIGTLKDQIDSACNALSDLNSPILPVQLVDYIKTQFSDYDKYLKNPV